MKILCVADHIDPLVYSVQIKQRFADIDLVLSAGDLPMDYLGFIASSLNKPVGFVFGNHNLKELPTFSRASRPMLDERSMDAQIRNHYGATYLDGRVRWVGPLLIAGLGGSMRYNDGEHQFTERQMYRRMVRLIPRLLWNRLVHGRYLDILLTHASPAAYMTSRTRVTSAFGACFGSCGGSSHDTFCTVTFISTISTRSG
jgi:hypothetical protein